MIELDVELVSEINKNSLYPGEPFGILDINRLESALGNQYAPYPNDEQAIASVFRSLIQNHPFMNGNKRTAVAAMFLMAESIDKEVVLSKDEVNDFIYQLASAGGSKISVTSIANKLFGLNLEEKLQEARATSALKSNGIFSVLNNKWVKEPVAADIPELDQDAFDKEFAKWFERYQDIVRGEDFSLENGSMEMVEKIIEKTHYEYIGPIYRFGRKWKNRVDLHTLASSKSQAINNFLYKAAEEIGYDRSKGSQVSIDTDLVFEYDPENYIDPDDDSPLNDPLRCERCGRLLNDNGECPLCDLGDESVLDEDLNKDENDKISEIEDFIEDVYNLRKTSIAEDGEYGIGNLVFKELRNLGCLDNLRDLKNVLLSRKFSLE